MKTYKINDLILQTKIPALPAVLIEVRSVLSRDGYDTNALAQTLGTDAVLSARTLRLANSALYAGRVEISDLKTAIVRIGPLMLSRLLIAAAVRQQFSSSDISPAKLSEFWRHSLYTACISKAIAKANNVDDPELFYLAALLHDIGKLVFLDTVTDAYEKVLESSIQGDDLIAAEKELFGFTHAELGCRLLERWNIPSSICEIVLNHHVTARVGSKSARIVAMADVLYHGLSNTAPVTAQLKPSIFPDIDMDSVLSDAFNNFSIASDLITQR